MKPIKRSKKTLGAILIGTAGIALATVGFSAWVVGNGSMTSENSSLGVNVASVSDNYVVFTTQPAFVGGAANACVVGEGNNDSDKMLVDVVNNPTEAYVVFGPRSDDGTGPIVASGFAQNDLEHLFVKYSFVVEWPSDKNLDISVAFSGSATITALESAATSNYIVNPNWSTSDATRVKTVLSNWDGTGTTVSGTSTGWSVSVGTKQTPSTGRSSQTVTIQTSWNWGSDLGNGTNPGVASDNSNSLASTFVPRLKDLYTTLSAASTLTMTVTAAVHS